MWQNTVANILAAYCTTAAMDTFIASNGDRHPTDLAALRGARMVCASETEEGRHWSEVRIKQLTGGDKIAARFMRQDFFEFVPQFKLTIIGNHQPELRNVDDAARRRANMAPFVHKPEKPDRKLEEKLRAEWPGILRWDDGWVPRLASERSHPSRYRCNQHRGIFQRTGPDGPVVG